MKPFLILQLRPNDEAAQGEFDAFLKYGNLSETDVHRVRMDQEDIPNIDFNDYSGIIVGGGPSNISDATEKKSDDQKRFESQLKTLIDRVITEDFPFLGACYGFGALAAFQPNGHVSKEQYSEPVSAVDISLREEGKNDPLLQDFPDTFRAMVGHKEACQTLPTGAVWLAEGINCPYQMFRLGKNVYATQFHPELDLEGIYLRIDVYKHAGYFPAEDAEKLKQELASEQITIPTQILERFVERYTVK